MRCWKTFEDNLASVSASIHRCELEEGHTEIHRAEGLGWSHNISMILSPITTDSHVAVPNTEGQEA